MYDSLEVEILSNNKKLKSLFSIASVIVAVFVLLAALTSCEQVEDLTMKKGSLKVFASLKSSEVGKVDLTGAEYVYSITKDGVTSTLQGLYNSMVFADIPAGNYTVSVSAYVEGEKVAAGTVGYEVTVNASAQSECRVYLSAVTSGGNEGSGNEGSGNQNQEDPIGLEIAMIDLSGDKFGNNPFLMGKYEVTYAQWYDVYAWAIKNGYSFSAKCFEGVGGQQGGIPTEGNLQPAVGITWRDSIVWCNAASEKANLTPVYYADAGFTTPLKSATSEEVVTRSVKGSQDCPYVKVDANGFRLPSVWEWEVAANAGNTYTYVGSDSIDEVAWYSENSGSKTHDVGTKKANAWGFYDMTGNLWERCVDWNGDWPIAKGGSWSNEAFLCEIGISTSATSYHVIGDYGFRVCRSVVVDYSGKTLDSISVKTGNLNDAQRAFSDLRTDVFTVLVRFTDGTTADVTSKAVFTTDTGTTSWGSCMVYDSKNHTWNYDTTPHTVKVSFTHKGVTKEFTSDGFTLKAPFEPNGSD